jgi:UDP-N-acetyl-2-amino-2-deoxyglucuronate dehydrogenase
MAPRNFAITGVGGYIAPRHLDAIHRTGNVLVAATDPNDSVGILDRYSFDVRFFPEIERFDRHLDKLRRGPDTGRVHYVSICSPNYLHDAHCRLALRLGADAICEKPLVINPWNLEPLRELEHESGRRIWTVLQLRVHPALLALRERLGTTGRTKHEIVLTYLTARGAWYAVSWKGSPEKSGGVAMNIGIHFFDLLLWLFGSIEDVRVHHADPVRMSGYLELERARVRWFLSVDPGDLRLHQQPGRTTFRSLTIDGEEVDFTEGFTDLHTAVYQAVLAGNGFGIDDAAPSIELVHRIRTAPVSPAGSEAHPLMSRA